MHCAEVARAISGGDVREPRISIHERSLDLKRCGTVHPVPMNHMSGLEASETDIANPPQLVIEFVAVEILLAADMGEHTVTLTLPDVERLAVSRIDEPVDVRLESLRNAGRERVRTRHRSGLIIARRRTRPMCVRP